MATDFELQVLRELSEIKSQSTSTSTRLQGFMDWVEADNKNCAEDRKQLHVNAEQYAGYKIQIDGLQKDMEELKSNAKEELWWDRGKTALGPVMVLIHIGLHKLGINI